MSCLWDNRGRILPVLFLVFFISFAYGVQVDEYTVEINVDERGLSQVETYITLDTTVLAGTIDLYAYSPTSVITPPVTRTAPTNPFAPVPSTITTFLIIQPG